MIIDINPYLAYVFMKSDTTLASSVDLPSKNEPKHIYRTIKITNALKNCHLYESYILSKCIYTYIKSYSKFSLEILIEYNNRSM